MNFHQPTETGKPDYDPLVDNFELLMKLSDDDNREYVVLVPVDDQEMELTPSGVVPPAYRMTSAFRGRNGQFIKKLD
ncbi:hypothetical protein CBL_09181 [Carabus blaptoides fortunei]